MSHLGIEIDDRALAIARDGELLSAAPSIVAAQPTEGRRAGAAAVDWYRAAPSRVATRHWFELVGARKASATSLSLARGELEERLRAHSFVAGETVSVVAPPRFDTMALGNVLAVAREAGLVVTEFVDAAVAAAATLGPRGTVVVLDIGLHHVGATRVDVLETEAVRRAALASRAGGLLAAQEQWLELIGDAMVRRTRFDPLHDAAVEQRLFEQLPAYCAAAARTGRASVVVDRDGEHFEVTLSRDQLATVAKPLQGALLSLVHELRPAGAPITLIGPAVIEEIPGLREALQELAGCELALLPAGFAARVASRQAAATPVSATVRVARRLPLPVDSTWLEELRAAVARSTLGGGEQRANPTHVLFSGQAIPLGAAPVDVGLAAGADGIRVAEGTAGVSRQHCSLRRDAGVVMLVDYSRFGSFVNGERVQGRTRLLAGDRVRVGDPGIELALIAVGANHETPAN